jgi:hypothetical protein
MAVAPSWKISTGAINTLEPKENLLIIPPFRSVNTNVGQIPALLGLAARKQMP